MPSDEEEILDLVNEQDEVIGTITHAQAYTITETKLGFLRASNAFIVNSDGKLWIPRRQSHKKIVPNGLDYSMGEHVQSKESYLDAAVRGFAEELNMGIKPSDLIFIGKVSPAPGLPPYFVCDYVYYSNEVPKYNKNDFVSAEWLTPQELKARLLGGDTGKASLPLSVGSLLAYQANHESDQ